jgi:hypothetical protein
VSRRVNSRACNGNIHNCPTRKSSKPIINGKTDVYTIFGNDKAQFWNTVRRGAEQ